MKSHRAMVIVILGAALLLSGWWVSLWMLPVRAAVPVPAAENGVLTEIEITGTQQARLDQQPVIFTATVAPLTATLPITYHWQATGQFSTSHVISASADVLSFTWETTGTKTLTVTANNAGGVLVSATHTLTIAATPFLSLTTLALDGPAIGVVGSPYTFTAQAGPVDATVPLTYLWQATGQISRTEVVTTLCHTLVFTWPVAGTQQLTVTATNGSPPLSATQRVTISVAPCVSLTGVTLSGPAAGVTHTAQAFTARVKPESAQLPITYTWQATGQPSVTHVLSDSLDTTAFSWTLTGAQWVTVTANNPCGALVTATHEIALVDALRVYLPLIIKPPEGCQPIPGAAYTAISVDVDHSQFPDPDAAHDMRFNINLFDYQPVAEYAGWVTYGTNTGTPRLIYLFSNPQLPAITDVYMLYEDGRAASPYPVSFLGLETTAEQIIHTPDRNAVIDQRGYVAMVLYAGEDTITLKYGREDGLARFDGDGQLIGGGYVVQLAGICVEPSLLELYEQVESAGRKDLPALYGHQALGRASGDEIRVAIRDTGTLMDPRSRNEWWYMP
ncbi:MAG: PKD domain-containing protein [Chloroflexota bacterium]|nr:PKD domain-containing protein [Chloroflexota bacterium]